MDELNKETACSSSSFSSSSSSLRRVIKVQIPDLQPEYNIFKYKLPVYIQDLGSTTSTSAAPLLDINYNHFSELRTSLISHLEAVWDFDEFTRLVLQLRVPHIEEALNVFNRIQLLKSYVSCYVVPKAVFLSDKNKFIFYSFVHVWCEVVMFNTISMYRIFDRVVDANNAFIGYLLDSEVEAGARKNICSVLNNDLSPSNMSITNLVNLYRQYEVNSTLRIDISKQLHGNNPHKARPGIKKRGRPVKDVARRVIPTEDMDVELTKECPTRLSALVRELNANNYINSDELAKNGTYKIKRRRVGAATTIEATATRETVTNSSFAVVAGDYDEEEEEEEEEDDDYMDEDEDN